MTEPKRRGRPPLAANEASVNVHFRVTTKEYDANVKAARHERLPVAEWIRRALREARKGFVSP